MSETLTGATLVTGPQALGVDAVPRRGSAVTSFEFWSTSQLPLNHWEESHRDLLVSTLGQLLQAPSLKEGQILIKQKKTLDSLVPKFLSCCPVQYLHDGSLERAYCVGCTGCTPRFPKTHWLKATTNTDYLMVPAGPGPGSSPAGGSHFTRLQS